MIRQFRVRFPVIVQLCEPLIAQSLAPCAKAAPEVFAHFIWNQELSILRPAIVSFRELDLFFTERFTVSAMRVLLVWRSPGYVTIYDDQRGTFIFFLSNLKGTP